MPTHNGLKIRSRRAKGGYGAVRERGLNDKNLSVLSEIAAEDFVELDPLFGQAPGRDGLRSPLRTFCSPLFPTSNG
jgi:hypothetical protein